MPRACSARSSIGSAAWTKPTIVAALHIALRTIWPSLYARHTRGFLRAASNIWFVLIGLSAVLTYQHHVMDVVAGFALGAYCFIFFPSRSRVCLWFQTGAWLVLPRGHGRGRCAHGSLLAMGERFPSGHSLVRPLCGRLLRFGPGEFFGNKTAAFRGRRGGHSGSSCQARKFRGSITAGKVERGMS